MLIFLAVTPLAFGDTVHFKDGTSLDGVVSYPDANTLTLGFGSGSMTFPAAGVQSVEKNDKTGDTRKVLDYRAKIHNESIDRRTGMNEEQRQQMNVLMEPLRSHDEGVRNEARKKLVEMGKKMPVFQYIESMLPYSKGRLALEMMQTLVELDPPKSKELVRPYTRNADPAIRAQAVELIAGFRNPDDIDNVASGIIDPDPDVRARTAHALANAGLKAATPVLIDGLKNADPRTQNACNTALKKLWEDEGQAAQLDSLDQWQQFWTRKSRKIKDAVNTEELEPLVTKEQLEKAPATHDE